MRDTVSIAGLCGKTGQEIGISGWFETSQDRIGGFADLTEDHQFIHVDPERACAESPFGGTIAHGFFTLSLLTAMSHQALPAIADEQISINYGFDKIRFLAPVPVGRRVRGRFTLKDAAARGGGQYLLRFAVTVEIEDNDRPALAAEWLIMTVVKEEDSK